MHTSIDKPCLFCNVRTHPSVHIIVFDKTKVCLIIDCLWRVIKNLSVVFKHLIFAIEMRWYVYVTNVYATNVYATMFIDWENIKASRFISSASECIY